MRSLAVWSILHLLKTTVVVMSTTLPLFVGMYAWLQ
jgi:hypothetical protein